MYCPHSTRQCVKSFHTIMAQLSSCERGCAAHKTKDSYYLALSKESRSIPGLWNESSSVYPAPCLGMECLLKNEHQVEAQEKSILPLSFPYCLNSLPQRALLFGDLSKPHKTRRRGWPAHWGTGPGTEVFRQQGCVSYRLLLRALPEAKVCATLWERLVGWECLHPRHRWGCGSGFLRGWWFPLHPFVP